MAGLRDLIDTVVIVMMENRSFDHMLGHLGLPELGPPLAIDALEPPTRTRDGRLWLTDDKYANPSGGLLYQPFHAGDDLLPADLPHDRDSVQLQLDRDETTGRYNMQGFVEAYRRVAPTDRTPTPAAVGFLGPDETPITTFLARQYCVCDRWFAPLPADTQPNRLMALSGRSEIDVTRSALLPNQPLVFDWLDDLDDVTWCIYSAGLPFELLFTRMWTRIASGRVRPFSSLGANFQDTSTPFPNVVFVEPSFLDAIPIIGQANDNHPPLPVGFGEQFLRTIYTKLIQSPRWKRTVMIVTYDEHGGFFDHVPPLPIGTTDPLGVYRPFDSTGVRVPGIVVSPLVEPGVPYHGNLDHTSILQFLAEVFRGDPAGYSPDVTARRRGTPSIRSVGEAINRNEPREDAPPPPSHPIDAMARQETARPAVTPNQQAFRAAIDGFRTALGPRATEKFPEIVLHGAVRG